MSSSFAFWVKSLMTGTAATGIPKKFAMFSLSASSQLSTSLASEANENVVWIGSIKPFFYRVGGTFWTQSVPIEKNDKLQSTRRAPNLAEAGLEERIPSPSHYVGNDNILVKGRDNLLRSQFEKDVLGK